MLKVLRPESLDAVGESTIDVPSVPSVAAVKPEVAAALAGLRPARPTTEVPALTPSPPRPAFASPLSPSMSPGIAPSMSPGMPSVRPPRPVTQPSQPSQPPSGASSVRPPRPTTKPSPLVPPASSSSSSSSWSPPRVNIKPIMWGLFVSGAALVCIALVRGAPAQSADAGVEVSAKVIDVDGLACTRLAARSGRLECAISPERLGALDEADRRARLDATRRQAGLAGYSGVVLVDNGRAWRVLHPTDVAPSAPAPTPPPR